MARETLWLFQCTDRVGEDVSLLKEEYMEGHLTHIQSIVEHIAVAGLFKDPSGEHIEGSLLAYRTDNLARPRSGSNRILMRAAASGRA